MLSTNEKIIKHKVGLLNLAEELGNVYLNAHAASPTLPTVWMKSLKMRL